MLLATEEAQAAAAVPVEETVPEMTDHERQRALALLEAPDLIDRVAEAFGVLGVVGERDSALVAWLTLTSQALGPAPRGGAPVVVLGREVDPGRRRPGPHARQSRPSPTRP